MVLAKMARAAGATAVGVTAAFAGSATSAVTRTSALGAAESVAAQFVTGFESYSYREPSATLSVADLATPDLAAVLTSPSQGAAGPALVHEKFSVTASVAAFEVESETPTAVELLARTAIRVSTVTGSSSSVRLVPVSLTLAPPGWQVSAVDGLRAATSPDLLHPDASPPPAAGAAPTTSTPAGPAGTATGPGAPSGSAGSPVTAVGDIPAAYVADMQAAVTAECPTLSWTVLAGIGKVESDFGRSRLPGVASGANPEGAEGPMQFEPATFAAYGTVAPDGARPASPYDPADAIFSAARLLCADGGGNPARLYAAVFDYNHSDAYVSLVLAYANAYARQASDGSSGVEELGLGSVIVADAETYLGVRYVWGGENPRTGFDCSGLVQWVYAQAGISLPRVAQAQYDRGPRLPAGAILYPGDLVFFGSGPSAVEHVGIYVGKGEMLDAPYTGAVVRFDRVAAVPLSFVGATRPEIPDLTLGAGVPVISNGPGHPGGAPSRPGGTQGQGHPRPGGSTHGGDGSPADPSHGGHRHPTTTTTTTPRSGRHHPTTTTSTTSTTDPTGTTTPPTRPGRHHPTTTTVPPTTTTPPTTTVPATTTTAAATTTTTPAVPPTTSPSNGSTTTSTGAGRRKSKTR